MIAEFNRLLRLGDYNVDNANFNEAIQYFKVATKNKTNDPTASQNLAMPKNN